MIIRRRIRNMDCKGGGGGIFKNRLKRLKQSNAFTMDAWF